MSGGLQRKTAFPIFNGYAPAEGPKALPLELDFSSVSEISENLLIENTEGVLQFVQAAYIDNSRNLNSFFVFVPSTRQRIEVPAGACGMFPILASIPASLVFSTTPASDLMVLVELLNVPMASYQSGPVTVNATVNPVARGTYTDFSDTITTGGASQTCIPANANRVGFFIQNPIWSDSESLFINFNGAAAVNGADSIELHPGETWPLNGSNIVTTQAITITGATTGHAFIAKELN